MTTAVCPSSLALFTMSLAVENPSRIEASEWVCNPTYSCGCIVVDILVSWFVSLLSLGYF